MVSKDLDITGKVCPFCLLIVKKEIKKLKAGDILNVLTDHPPAAKENIPAAMKKVGNDIEINQEEPGLWILKIIKK